MTVITVAVENHNIVIVADCNATENEKYDNFFMLLLQLTLVSCGRYFIIKYAAE